MRLETIRVRNFRLLKRAKIDLAAAEPTTVLVGPNNCGKTSLADALRLFTASGSERLRFAIHDLAYERQRTIGHIEGRLTKIPDEDKQVALLNRFAPRIRLDLVFSYGQSEADLNAASPLLMTLDASDNRIAVRVEFRLSNGLALLRDFKTRVDPAMTLRDFLATDISKYFELAYFKISADGRQAIALDKGDAVHRLLLVDWIPAQRHIDDQESTRAAKISRLLHDHYNRYYQVENAAGYQEIQQGLRVAASDLTTKYESAFERLRTSLKGFGYPQSHATPDIKIRAEISAETVYRDNTRVYYANQKTKADGAVETYELPERYNGLGYKNLIFMVLQIESFRAAFDADPIDRPRVHLVFIEEPEAHLHPQMQCVFMREIKKAVATTKDVTPQVVLTTHSAHIVSDSGFEPIRYFRRKGDGVSVRDLSRLPVPPAALPFLRRYLKFSHCDLFFADKAVLIEGQVERLLLPLIIENRADLASLQRQYVSIAEVGGAYAHKFAPLIEFLGIPTLVITDIDSTDSAGKKCPVACGVASSNQALTTWLPGKSALADLRSSTDVDKTRGRLCVAYQVEEAGQCGRSFEEAFIYANIDWLVTNAAKLEGTAGRFNGQTAATLPAAAYDLASSLPKVDFALDLMAVDGWKPPSYILAGLKWLAGQEAN